MNSTALIARETAAELKRFCSSTLLRLLRPRRSPIALALYRRLQEVMQMLFSIPHTFMIIV